MKRTERHRLKENEVALSVARARETFEIYRKPIIAAVVGVVAIVVIVAGLVMWRQQVDEKSRTLLADAMVIEAAPVAPAPAPGQTTPPPAEPGSFPNEQAKRQAALQKYLAAADAYPSSPAGIAARYHAASILALLGRNADAVKQYQEVVDRVGSGSIYGEMAKLGSADVEAATGQYDKAIAKYSELASRKDAKLPVEGVLMQLGRAYQEKGSAADAKKTFKRIVDEFPQSPYATAAKRELDAIKG
jgi:tetratricopeptide (TPR) repeat protein